MELSRCLLLAVFFSRYRAEIPSMAKYYCVIGAGPSGLQMAYFLERAQRDYVVFEQSAEPDDDSLRFTKYSEEYFPTADSFTEYLRDYQKKLKLAVLFNKQISDIKYHSDAKTAQCRYTMRDQEKNLYCCRNVLIGTGWQKETVPVHLRDQDHVHTYDTMSVDPLDYKDKTVLIIGRGFSGIETALAVDGSARYVHLVSANPIRLNWEARYLGNLRGMESKMFDGFEEIFELDVEKISLKKRTNGKVQLVLQSPDNEIPQQVPLEGYDRVILCLGFQWSDSIFHESMKVSSFDKPDVPKNTYPHIGNDYQSDEYPGLYFIGPLVHALDYKKSAGGFIHGFRNIGRALHRLLEWRNHGIRWPSVTKSIDQLPSSLLKRADESSGLFHMFSHLCDFVIYDGSKKFAYLEEVPIALVPLILKHAGYEFNTAQHSAFILLFQYGAGFSHPGVDQLRGTQAHAHLPGRDLTNVLHPTVYYYENCLPTAEEIEQRQEGIVLPKATAVHHILRDITTTYDGPTAHIMLLRRFIQTIVNEDLRTYTAQTCVAYAFTQKRDSNTGMKSVCRNYNVKYDSALLFQ